MKTFLPMMFISMVSIFSGNNPSILDCFLSSGVNAVSLFVRGLRSNDVFSFKMLENSDKGKLISDYLSHKQHPQNSKQRPKQSIDYSI